MTPVPPRLRAALAAMVRGESADWPDDITPDEAAALDEHGVLPLAYRASGASVLRDDAIRAAAIEPLLQDDIASVLDALGKRSIDVLVIKGSALAYQIYASPELRPRSDTDLLIAPADVERVRAAMGELGFAEPLTSGDEHVVHQSTFLRTDAFEVEHAYDVHWDVTNKPAFAAALRFEDLLARSIPVPALGAYARALDRVDALLLACVHRVAHHHDTDRLIWLIDIALLAWALSEDEEQRFWRQAEEGRVIGVCERSIALAAEWSGLTLTDPRPWLSEEELQRSEPSRVFLDRELTYGSVMLSDFGALSWRARVERAWQLAFPPPSFMRQEFGARSAIALPFLYVYRGVRGVRRLFGRVGTRS